MRLKLATSLVALASSGAVAADLLPLRHGIYVPVSRPCKGASNANIVNYRGGRSSLGFAQAECTIVRVSNKGNAYTVTDSCVDIQSGERIEGGPNLIIIGGPSDFTMSGTAYRYCGAKVQF